MECCDNSGGRVIFRVGDRTWSTRGGITVKPTVVERAAESNDDGSIYTTTKAVPAEAEFTLTDKCDLPIDELINGCHVDATIELFDMGRRRWLFTDASIVGRPEYNTESGEISGLKIVSANVTVLRAAA